MHPLFIPSLKTRPSALALAIAAQAALAPLSTAEATEENIQLETVVVVGKIGSGIDSLVDAQDLENMQAVDVADIFRHDPEISAGGAISMGQKLYVRNLGEDQLNITVDGAEQASGIFHHAGRVLIEPELLKRVEVEAGAGTAAAGPGALGGSVRFVTKDPIDLLQPGEQAGAMLKSSYLGNGESLRNTVIVYGADSGGTISGMATFTHGDFNSTEDGNGDEILGTALDKTMGYAKVVATISSNQYLSFSHERVEEEGALPYKPEWAYNDQGPSWSHNLLEDTSGERATSIINYDLVGDQWLDLSVNAYHTDSQQDRYSSRWDEFSVGSVITKGVNLNNKSHLGDHQFTYGFNYRTDDSRLLVNDAVSGTEDGKVWGVFVQDTAELTSQVTVSAGVRFDDYELTDNQNQSLSDQGVSPNISLRYAFTDEWAISTGYAEAFRGPSVKDAFKLFGATSNAADLSGETSKNIEVTLDYQGVHFNASMGAYDSVIEDAHGLAVPWSKQTINLEQDLDTTGFFIRAGYNLGSLSLNAGYNQSETTYNGEDATRYVFGSNANTIGDTLVLDASYHVSDALALGWSAEFVKGIDNIALNVGGSDLVVDKPGYGTHDLYVRWQGLADDALTLTLTAKNLTDKYYLHHASVEDFTGNAEYDGVSGQASPGRDIRLSAAFRF